MSEQQTTDKGRPISAQIRTLGGLLLCLLPIMLSGSKPPSVLEKIQQEGILEMISLNGPTTYYEGPFGYTGFEYELAEAFANDLGVELVVDGKDNLSHILDDINTESGHFVAAGLSVIDSRRDTVDFSLPYSSVTQQVIYRRGSPKPKKIEDLIGKDIVVISQSSHAANLRKLQKEYPELKWREEVDVEMLDLLEMIHSGNAEITIVDSTTFITNRAVYPKARLAFDISSPEKVAWAFPKQGDTSLMKAANVFLDDYIEEGKVEELEQKYFHKKPVDVGSALAFAKHIEKRLPQWSEEFKKAAKAYKLDWLFLAAISYQESLWNKDARSYTGVRGLMMLTTKTAKDLGVKDRRDPYQSIHGGAKYFDQMRKRIPDDIKEPDRTWMALASYNVGYGHLEDARILTELEGGDPHLWNDVKRHLPLLAIKKYYTKTRHGYARGWEPVKYVERIRNYHEILVWNHQLKERQIAIEKEKTESLNYSQLSNGNMSQL